MATSTEFVSLPSVSKVPYCTDVVMTVKLNLTS